MKRGATEAEIATARRLWQGDDLEIDDGAAISRDTEEGRGYWVAAWVWIDHPVTSFPYPLARTKAP